jgi:hypothetical protein
MRSRVVQEGLRTGLLGAISVAIWFLTIDFVVGQPLETPALLGRALFGLIIPDATSLPFLVVLVGYTAFHLAAFAVVGLVVAAIVQRAVSEPTVLAGALILFVMFEVGFHALLSIMGSVPVLGVLAWYRVAVGNLAAAVTMGLYIWKAHPELKSELAFALEEREYDR